MSIPTPATLTSLEAIAAAVHDCTACPLAAGRLTAVPGDGNPHSPVLFVGEGPGQKEDETGHPFIGAAGKFLDEMLSAIGQTRSDVFVTNVVKCRPPENRDPEPDEIHTCTDLFLWKQIEFIAPKLIVTLGRHSMGLFFPPEYKISQIHGQPKRVRGRVVLPLYHPAAALYNGGMRQTLIYDFKKIPLVLKKVQLTP
ncbi:MAG: uracil-DNA glycosylase [Candidatus Kerfeldbacteria bacterium]|nr:uracil-DNA glycosylase [Candidatus Kerfeldbacteria bacterium]